MKNYSIEKRVLKFSFKNSMIVRLIKIIKNKVTFN